MPPEKDGSDIPDVLLWRYPDNVSHCRLVPVDEAGWRFVQTSPCRRLFGPVAGKPRKVNRILKKTKNLPADSHVVSAVVTLPSLILQLWLSLLSSGVLVLS